MSRTIRRGALVAALAAGIVVATPAVASAHVGVSPDSIPRGASTLLTFSFGHGCAGSPTKALRITIPDEAPVVSPTFDAAWSTEIEKGADGYASAVTFTAIRPVPNELRGAVSFSFRPAEDAPDQLAFPVEQICEEGANEWVQIADAGQTHDDLDSPAPVVSLTAAQAEGEHGDQSGDQMHGDAEGAESADAEQPATSPVPVVLGSAGLAAGIAALIVSIAAYRRRRA
ncbi:YcnI family copper-binding membrane protein [Microbacterium suwonense]|uniref:YncI copper-binding domain-containing protein n=1 Tax=Microbacterium suwonense TaxID=683047 RepID=A0ABN6X1S0_9MICO|nr:YcnI family protein [Microbacterium suwonense]BDZ38631.1 hypothetical protein GCM10025863_12450 [Microbacterium suwonense]